MTQRRSRTAEKLVSSSSHPLTLASSALLQSRLWSPQVEIPPFSGRHRSSPRSLLLANACRVQAERMQREDQSARGSGAMQLTVLPVFDCIDNGKSCSFIGLAPESSFRRERIGADAHWDPPHARTHSLAQGRKHSDGSLCFRWQKVNICYCCFFQFLRDFIVKCE